MVRDALTWCFNDLARCLVVHGEAESLPQDAHSVTRSRGLQTSRPNASGTPANSASRTEYPASWYASLGRPVILLGWRAQPFRRRSAHALSGTSCIAQGQSTDSRTRHSKGYGPVQGHLLQLSRGGVLRSWNNYPPQDVFNHREACEPHRVQPCSIQVWHLWLLGLVIWSNQQGVNRPPMRQRHHLALRVRRSHVWAGGGPQCAERSGAEPPKGLRALCTPATGSSLVRRLAGLRSIKMPRGN